MPEFVWELPPLLAPAPEEQAEVVGMARNHADEAVERLALQFRKPKMIALVRAYCARMQLLEQAFVDIITKRNIDDATSFTLELLAKFVGQRLIPGIDESTLRSFIRARIRTNKSSGLGDQILRIARLVLTDYANDPEVAAAGSLSLSISNLGIASYILRVNGIDLTWELATILADDFLRVANGVGIRSQLVFDVQEDDIFDVHDDAFTLDDGADIGSVTTGLGLAGTYATLEWPSIFMSGNDFVAVERYPTGIPGRTLRFVVQPGGPESLDESDPMNIIVRVKQMPFDFPPSQWVDVYAVINTSAYIRIETEIAAGDVVVAIASPETFTDDEIGGFLASVLG